ncbi:hypothetical protein TNCV_873611 [Trichonephila clavipes]|nr:hypothetical protein TNCV_873611 [Trichonephila clavipes]
MSVKGDIEDVSSELDNGVTGCTAWMKRPELYCSRLETSLHLKGIGGMPKETELTRRGNKPCNFKQRPRDYGHLLDLVPYFQTSNVRV